MLRLFHIVLYIHYSLIPGFLYNIFFYIDYFIILYYLPYPTFQFSRGVGKREKTNGLCNPLMILFRWIFSWLFNLLIALAGTNWGQQKETLLLTYKALGRSIANYAAPVWNTNASDTSLGNIHAHRMNH